MQNVPTDMKSRAPSSRVLQEVIRQAPAEYVTIGWLTSITPVPLSNVAPAMVISLISLAYVEEDGLLLSAAFSCRDCINRDWISSGLGNNCRRGPYQRLGVLGQPDDGTLGGSLYTSSGHSSSTSSRISSETSERPSVSNRNLCSRSKSSCTMMWSEIIRGA
jgi:Exopolysaccharide synthesis, ExoD